MTVERKKYDKRGICNALVTNLPTYQFRLFVPFYQEETFHVRMKIKSTFYTHEVEYLKGFEIDLWERRERMKNV